MWKTEDDARAAADWLIEQAASMEVPSWSSREIELTRIAAGIAMEKRTLGPFHQFVLTFSEQLRGRSDLRGYKELWKAVVDAENTIGPARRYQGPPERFAV